MKSTKIVKIILAVLMTASCHGFAEAAVEPAAIAATETVSATAATSDSTEFPLMLKGTEVIFSKDAKREDLTAKLTQALGESTEMEEATRLQYDFQIDPESSSVTLVIDWDEAGNIAEIILDGEEIPTKELQAWLSKNAGAGKEGEKEEDYTNTVWEYNGWSFAFRAGGSDEDTAYSFTIVPLQSK
ncbi:MAG: hypothetical protein KKB51_03585 [Candidatus Riflebacteria bacterium]|nr:hypothetical protein [Candidatus Riflebacteria bacterium]